MGATAKRESQAAKATPSRKSDSHGMRSTVAQQIERGQGIVLANKHRGQATVAARFRAQQLVRAQIAEEARIEAAQAYAARLFPRSAAAAGRNPQRSLAEPFWEAGDLKEERYGTFIERIRKERANEIARQGMVERERKAQARAAAIRRAQGLSTPRDDESEATTDRTDRTELTHRPELTPRMEQPGEASVKIVGGRLLRSASTDLDIRGRPAAGKATPREQHATTDSVPAAAASASHSPSVYATLTCTATASGGEVMIVNIQGSEVPIRVPAGILPGQQFQVRLAPTHGMHLHVVDSARSHPTSTPRQRKGHKYASGGKELADTAPMATNRTTAAGLTSTADGVYSIPHGHIHVPDGRGDGRQGMKDIAAQEPSRRQAWTAPPDPTASESTRRSRSISSRGVWQLSTGAKSRPPSELTEFPYTSTTRAPLPQRWYFLTPGKRVYVY
jgi:hypothetical protein